MSKQRASVSVGLGERWPECRRGTRYGRCMPRGPPDRAERRGVNVRLTRPDRSTAHPTPEVTAGLTLHTHPPRAHRSPDCRAAGTIAQTRPPTTSPSGSSAGIWIGRECAALARSRVANFNSLSTLTPRPPSRWPSSRTRRVTTQLRAAQSVHEKVRASEVMWTRIGGRTVAWCHIPKVAP